ncbi:MAG: hypothetical protein E7207_07395 [Clostridium butyricum]|nr:hypothetical protein [Clostridium butyricum]
MNNIPCNEYLLVMPNGDCKGFNDLREAKAYINIYYERKIDADVHEDDYNDATDIGGGEARNNICTQLGVEEGKCEVYNLEQFIQKLEEELVFDNEKDEIISKLMEEDLDINIYNYNLDMILADVDSIDMMEPYGEIN